MQETMEGERLQEEVKTYNTREAISYLDEKYGIHIEANSFYQSARRMRPPPKKVRVGMSMRYAFTKEELDNMYFVKAGLKRHAVYPHYQVEEIRTDGDMQELKEKYGRIVDGKTLIDIIEEEYKVRPSPESIKQRRHRKSIPCVGVSGVDAHGQGRKTYWYAADMLKGLSFKHRFYE
jgi:hypothetical protein